MISARFVQMTVLMFVVVAFAASGHFQKAHAAELTLEDARDIFDAGNSFYQHGQFAEAAQAYGEVVDAGYRSAPAYYNLGTAEARVGSNTLALAHLVRAQKQDPRNDDVAANLRFVLGSLQQGSAGASPIVEKLTNQSVWERVYGWFMAEEWLLIIWMILLIGAAGVSFAVLTKRPQLAVAGRGVAIVAGILTLLLVVPAGAQIYASKFKKEAVIIAPSPMLSGPAQRFTQVQMLGEGQLVRLMNHESDGYVRVQSRDGRTGYVRLRSLLELY